MLIIKYEKFSPKLVYIIAPITGLIIFVKSIVALIIPDALRKSFFFINICVNASLEILSEVLAIP